MIGKSKDPKRVLVLGDSILDHDIVCNAMGLSLETPTLKARLHSENYKFGGAANVVNNLLALGSFVTYVTPVAADKYESKYHKWEHPRLDLIPLSYQGQNIVKSRYWIKRGEHSYKHLQINQGTLFVDVEKALKTISDIVVEGIYDAIILVDYRGGLFSRNEVSRKLVEAISSTHSCVYAASQVSDRESQYSLFEGVDVICLNEQEARSELEDFSPIPEDILRLSRHLDTRVCVTLGSHGSTLHTRIDTVESADAYSVAVKDTCGAGDSFLAALVASDEDLEFSNKWAAASTQQIGTSVPNLEEVLAWE